MNQKYIIGVIGAVLVIAGVVFYTNSSTPVVAPVSQNAPAKQAQGSTTTVSTVPVKATIATTSTNKPTVKVVPVVISNVVLASTITKTATSIQPGKVTTTFTPMTKDIYAVLSLKNATTKTQLSYIRKFGGKYVDSKVSHPLKAGDKQFYFSWPLVSGQTRNIGEYSLTFYVDGNKAQTVAYSIR